MTIFIENSPELQSARRYILGAMSLGFVLWLVIFFGMFSWVSTYKGFVVSLKNSPWLGFYLFLLLTMFVAQVVGYYKLAKVSRNLLLFRCVAFPYIADALLSLCGLLVFKNPADMLQLKFLTLALYAYYNYRLFMELTRVTQDPLFKYGMLVIGLCFMFILFMVLILGSVSLYRFVIFGVWVLWWMGVLVGWSMIVLGFVRFKQISYP